MSSQLLGGGDRSSAVQGHLWLQRKFTSSWRMCQKHQLHPPKKTLQYQNKKSPSLTERGTETQRESCPGLHLSPDSKKSRPPLKLSAQASGLGIPETGQSFPSARENCKDHA